MFAYFSCIIQRTYQMVRRAKNGHGMNIRFRFVALVFPFSFSLIACSTQENQADPAESKIPEVKKEQISEPKTPEDFLDRAEEAMGGEKGWMFRVKGNEGLVLQGQENTASYKATVKRTQEPEAFHSQGTITTSKGKNKPEEIFVIGGTAYIREGGEGWKQSPLSDPETKNKVEDPVMAIEAFRQYLKGSADDVTLAKRDGEVQLQVGVSSKKLPEVQDRAFVEKAVREMEPTLEQLKKAGVPVNKTQLTLSRLEETLVLDAKTHQIKTHQLKISFLIPYGGQSITYKQDVKEEMQGVFDGAIKLPAGVN
ncbi:DUF6612 family protein [Streptomyces gobiensis]|uniref:DUF6612 family protein n=1 Tax=Streptomyces gobiensis TaxID=2875706 RepID=UPI001E3687E5|nr:DUF6612 family protein [Streptomyces gobiensis]UGY93261.1 hypothetical protein test1122_17085 [Streptomyces gobiensis]